MKQMLSPREFYNWLSYYMFKDPDENEIQMAVLSHMVASGLGAKESTFEKYLINKYDSNKPTNKPTTTTPAGVLSKEEVMSVFSGIAVPLEG